MALIPAFMTKSKVNTLSLWRACSPKWVPGYPSLQRDVLYQKTLKIIYVTLNSSHYNLEYGKKQHTSLRTVRRNGRYLVVPILRIFVECATSLKLISIPTLSERYQPIHTAVNPYDHWNVWMFPLILVYLDHVVWFILWKNWYIQ